MKSYLNIKGLSLNKDRIKYTLLVILIFISFNGSGIFILDFMQNRTLQENFSKTTEVVKSIWNTTTTTHQETMESYLRYYILDDEVLRLFEEASQPEKQSYVRFKLYRHLDNRYQELKSKLYVRQLNFVLPDNTMFIRFHAPNRYGDDLSYARPSIVYVNREKKPFAGTEMGKIVFGYRYIFPVFNKDGRYLGCVELSRSFEVIRKTLTQVDTKSEYVILINKSEIEKKVLTEYKGYYKHFLGLSDWLVEDTDGKLLDEPKHMEHDYLKALSTTNLNQIVNSPEDVTVYTKIGGKYYKITVIKFNQPYENTKPLALLRVAVGDDINSIIETFSKFKLIYIISVIIMSVGILLYLNKNYSMKVKTRELELITSTMGSGLVILNTEGLIRFINQTALKILGFSNEDLTNLSFHDIAHNHIGPKESCPIFLAVKHRKDYDGDDVFKTKDGKLIDVSLKIRPMLINDNYIGSVVVFDDITERKQLEKKLFNLATVDPLTDLYNRRYSTESMIKYKNQSDRYGNPLSIIILDIDDFKKINDTYGHDIGDEVLKGIAKIIKENIRSSDIPSRWGGEEFLVVLPNTDLEGAIYLAERIRESVSQLKVGPVERLTVSLGVAQYKSGNTIDKLVVMADRGLYEAKRSGKNKVVAIRE